MSEIAEFLLARIGEDEEIARSAVSISRDGEHREWEVSVEQNVYLAELGSPVATGPWGGGIDEAQHIARWDPARVLAECEAKRRIVELHAPGGSHVGGFRYCAVCASGDPYESVSPSAWPCETLLVLAAVYADHPEYRAYWALEAHVQ